MQAGKEKLSNMASAAKEHVNIYKANAEEKAEKATARSVEEKEIAHERRKAKEAQAKMELHEAKAEHKADKMNARHSLVYGHHDPPIGTHGHHQPLVGTDGGYYYPTGTAAPTTGATTPIYQVTGHPTAEKYL